MFTKKYKSKEKAKKGRDMDNSPVMSPMQYLTAGT